MTLVEILLILILGLMAIAVPIGFAVIAGVVGVLLWVGDINLMVVPQSIFGSIDGFTLLAIPFFLLAGSLMTAGGMTRRLLELADAMLGHKPGGLAMSGVVASTLFAGISGSAVADTSALGRIMIPAMVKVGHRPAFAASLIAAANVVAPVIPPSIPFIVMGVLTNQSITNLFLAGVIPGLLYTVAMLWIARRLAIRDAPAVRTGKRPPGTVRRALARAAFALLMPVFILVGIRMGVFNITECSGVAVVYALFVGGVVHRELDLKRIYAALVSAGRSTAVIMIVVGAAKLFSWLLAYTGVPQAVSAFVLANVSDALVFLLVVNVLLLIIGMFLEANAALVMLVPVLYPIALALGVDPVHFGVVVVLNLCIGLITPPVGLCLNIACMIARSPLERGSVAILPFLAAALAVLLLVTLVPQASLLLPGLAAG